MTRTRGDAAAKLMYPSATDDDGNALCQRIVDVIYILQKASGSL